MQWRDFARAGSAIAGAVAAAFALAGPASAQGSPIDMKIGMVTINDSQHQISNWFAAEVEKRTNGKLKPRVFPSAQLGGIARQVEGVQLGTQEAFVSPPAFFVGSAPAFQAADGPGLFDSLTHQNRVLNDPKVRDNWLNIAASTGVVGLFSWGAGEPAISCIKPIRSSADLKGLKLRVLATKVETGLMAEFGATGIPIDFAEALAAIQNKVIDGARSAITVMGPSRFYTVAKYITLTADIYVPSGIWVSKLWLDKLPSDVRKVVDDVSKEAVPLALRYSIEVTNRWEDEWAKNGGEVIRFAAADRAEYMRRASPLGENFLGKHDNAKVREMYQLLRSVADATRGG